MDFFSHFVIGILSSLVLLKPFSPEFILFAGIMAILPDWDIFLIPFQKITKSYYLTHRGASHSYVTALIVSAIMGAIFHSIYGNPFVHYWLVGFLFYSLHVSCDLITTSKIPIFYPISKKEYCFRAERAVNPFLMLCSFIIILISVNLNQISIRFIYYRILVNTITIVYFLYFIYKLITKTWIQKRLPETSRFIPGVFPLFYMIYENQKSQNKLEFNIFKKIQFLRKNKKIISSKIEGINEIEYFEKAKSLSNEYRFFSKFENIIPFIREDKEFINIRLFLAETLTLRSAYFLNVKFDKKSGGVIDKSDGFGLIKKI